MKQTGIVATLLTFFSLLLVLTATVIFLLQDRQDLRGNVARLESEVESHNLAMAEFQSTATVRERALATSHALIATRDWELTQSQEAYGSLKATRDAEYKQQANETPLVKIVRPVADEAVSAGAPLEITVVAGHTLGIARMHLDVGDEPVTFEGPDDARSYVLFTHRALRLPSGPLTITATITTTNELTSSDVVTITVRGSASPESSGLQTIQPLWATLPFK